MLKMGSSVSKIFKHSTASTEASQQTERQSHYVNVNDILICKICYLNPLEIAFLPCGHVITCVSCANKIIACPLCRVYIKATLLIYL